MDRAPGVAARMAAWAAGVLFLLPAVAPADCTGDCDGDGQVAVNELILGVNIALANRLLEACPVMDADGSGTVAVNELITAVRHALEGCPAEAAYVGWDACRPCHAEQYREVAASGHPYKLVHLGGEAPAPNPNADLTPNGNFPLLPPQGYDWSDISYVIGGWGWKVRFMDRQGYIITCPPGDTDADGDGYCDAVCAGSTPETCDAAPPDAFEGQWNLYAEPGSDKEWVPYDMGQYRKPYDCGRCHTTGYDSEGSFEGMPGIVGSWSEPGIRCEACHGPGSLHVGNPTAVDMIVDTRSELCGTCHVRGGVEDIDASGGFIRHHEQWDELFHSPKHGKVDCVDCHDPHRSAKFDLERGITDRDPEGDQIGMKLTCQNCHPGYAERQKSVPMRAVVRCVDCHMPYAARSALAVGPFMGDVRSHLFEINTDPAAPQFSEDGRKANPYLTLDFACRGCHKAADGDPQPYSVRTDGQLHACAEGYHEVGPGFTGACE